MSDNQICDGSCNARAIVIDDEEPETKRAKLTESISDLCARESNGQGASVVALIPAEKVQPHKETVKDVHRFLFGENKLKSERYYIVSPTSYPYQLSSFDECCGLLDDTIKAMIMCFEDKLSAVHYEYTHYSSFSRIQHHDHVGIKLEHVTQCYQGQRVGNAEKDRVSEILVLPWIFVYLHERDQTIRVSISCDQRCYKPNQKHSRSDREIIQTKIPPFPPSTDKVKEYLQLFWNFCTRVFQIRKFDTEMECNEDISKLFESIFGKENCDRTYLKR